MPESPEVQALTDFLDAHATGRTITGSEVVEGRALKTRARPLSSIAGATVQGARRFGKHIDLALGTDVGTPHLVISFGRAGWATWADAVAPSAPEDRPGGEEPAPPAPEIVRIDLSEGVRVGLTDAGEWLSLGVSVVDDPAEVSSIAKLGPDPLDPSFTRQTLESIVHGRRKQLKALLAEQESIAGIGNAYSDEILNVARLSPVAHAASLEPAERDRLFDAIVGVLRSAADARRGLPIDRQKSAKVASMRVHGRTGQECPACGGTILDIPGSKGGAQYCPACQTGGEEIGA